MGMGKTMLMAAKKAGVDIENEDEIKKFRYNFNQQHLANTKKLIQLLLCLPLIPGKRRSVEMIDVRAAVEKNIRNAVEKMSSLRNRPGFHGF